MLLEHHDHPGRGIRLGYCLNLHPADDLDGLLRGMSEITLPLAERLGGARLREGFGVGLWLPAHVAMAMTVDEGAADAERLVEFLVAHRLDPFTFNAFPYGGFHRDTLKEAVFRPTWKAPERLAFTLSVAALALETRAAVLGGSGEKRHTSISTHTGMYGAWIESAADRDACAENVALFALQLAQFDSEAGDRIILSLEPEPRSLANDTRELPAYFERIRVRAREVLGRGHPNVREVSEEIVRRHIGTCLDACHAAVEFESSENALHNSTAAGVPLGKLQFSSALALPHPADDADGRARLLAMDEPIYLHQVTGKNGSDFVRASDLGELRAALEAGGAEADAWNACDEWRCHFHVPVDLERVAGGLGTTRSHADDLLARVVAAPERWGTHELHVEIETYTWDILPREARGSGDLVDGLEREYRHVLTRLAEAGWFPATI